jgi:hypothetical protein
LDLAASDGSDGLDGSGRTGFVEFGSATDVIKKFWPPFTIRQNILDTYAGKQLLGLPQMFNQGILKGHVSLYKMVI